MKLLRIVGALTTLCLPVTAFLLSYSDGPFPKLRFHHRVDEVPSHPWPLWGYRHVGEATLLIDGSTEPHLFKDHGINAYGRALGAGSVSLCPLCPI